MAEALAGAEWGENDDDAPYIPPPRLINAVRLYLPYKGYIEIGLWPETDGYGNASVTTTINIVYGLEWLSLKEEDVAAFFCAVRATGYTNVDGVFYTAPDPSYHSSFQVRKVEDSLEIIFREVEGDQTAISLFQEDDAIALLKMERIIAARCEYSTLTLRSVIESIEALAIKCNGKAESVKDNLQIWHCDTMELEMATNHFTFFYDLVEEIKRSNDQNVM